MQDHTSLYQQLISMSQFLIIPRHSNKALKTFFPSFKIAVD
jgi:hypothetical protein